MYEKLFSAKCYQTLEKDCDSGSGKRPPGFLPVLRGVLMVGLGSVVSARADAAAECWAFLMLVPSASQCWSPSVSLTEKIWQTQETGNTIDIPNSMNLWRKKTKAQFVCKNCSQSTLEWAGPCSHSSLYSGWILLKRAISFTKHMGVFSLGFAMLDTVTKQKEDLKYSQLSKWTWSWTQKQRAAPSAKSDTNYTKSLRKMCRAW